MRRNSGKGTRMRPFFFTLQLYSSTRTSGDYPLLLTSPTGEVGSFFPSSSPFVEAALSAAHGPPSHFAQVFRSSSPFRLSLSTMRPSFIKTMLPSVPRIRILAADKLWWPSSDTVRGVPPNSFATVRLTQSASSRQGRRWERESGIHLCAPESVIARGDSDGCCRKQKEGGEERRRRTTSLLICLRSKRNLGVSPKPFFAKE